MSPVTCAACEACDACDVCDTCVACDACDACEACVAGVARVPYASSVATMSRQALALRAAEEGVVLMKNEHGLLPLGASRKKIAVVGPNGGCDTIRNGSADPMCAGRVQLLGSYTQVRCGVSIVRRDRSNVRNESSPRAVRCGVSILRRLVHAAHTPGLYGAQRTASARVHMSPLAHIQAGALVDRDPPNPPQRLYDVYMTVTWRLRGGYMVETRPRSTMALSVC